MECPTVKIVTRKIEGNELGFLVINEEDFDPEQGHVLYEESSGDADADAEKAALIARALKLKLAPPSVLERWSTAKLTAALADRA